MRVLHRTPGFPWRAPTVPGGVAQLEVERMTGVRYDSSWSRREPARYARFFILEGPMRAAVRAVASPTRRGLDRLGGVEGPLIFAANHHSHVDAPLLLTSIPEPWRHRIVVAAAADYFFSNRLASAASALAMGAFPVERTGVSRRSTDLAGDLLVQGWSLLIFPEGGRSPDGWGQGHRRGAAFLATRAEVPVVPVHIEGTGGIFAKGDRRPRPGSTTVTFGRPLRLADGEDARGLAVRIEDAVATLADEARTDWWSARQRAAASATPSLSGPETTSWRRAWALGDRRRSTRRVAAERPWPPC